jgi:subtilisin family serine protease
MHKFTPSSGFGSMKPHGRFAMAALSLAAALACGGAAAQGNSPGSESFAAGRILVMPRAGMPEAALAAILKENGGGKARRVGKSELRIVDLPPGLEKQSVEKLARHPHIEFAELDQLVAPNLVTNDPYLGSQWHLPKIRATTAWDNAQGSGVTIAILDTGVDAAHPDLSSRMVPGWNWFDNNSNTADVYGHGTQVAGAAAAAANNAVGVAGVAGQSRIMPIRVSDLQGYASWSALTQGITWAADHGARVVNISYVVANSAAVISAANYMKSKGGLVVTSAGNYGTDANITPTASMIPVSATDSNDAKTSWSSYGSFVAMAAPGAGIYSTTRGGGYAPVSGTSFSSPITAGAIAVIMSANPKLTSAEVENVLYSTAVDLGSAGRDNVFGYGRVDVDAAVNAASAVVSTVDATLPKASIAAPLGSATVSGLVPVNVSASDNVGVTKVELRANGALVGTDTSSPFTFSWDSTKVANGMASLVATAYDAAGNAGNSATVAVNVANDVIADTTPPSVRIANPGNGTKVSGTVGISATASDNLGAGAVRQTLLINGRSVASTTGGSLSYSWNTRKIAAGSYTIQAVATDAAGNSATTSVSVTR